MFLAVTSPSSMHFDITTSWQCGALGSSWVLFGQHVAFQPWSWWGSSTPRSSWSASLPSSSSRWRLSISSTSTCSCWHASMPGRLLPCPTVVKGGVGIKDGGATAWKEPWLSLFCSGHLWCAGHHFSSTSSSLWCAQWTHTASVTDHCSNCMWCCSRATPSLTRQSMLFASLSSDIPSGGCCFVLTGGGPCKENQFVPFISRFYVQREHAVYLFLQPVWHPWDSTSLHHIQQTKDPHWQWPAVVGRA